MITLFFIKMVILGDLIVLHHLPICHKENITHANKGFKAILWIHTIIVPNVSGFISLNLAALKMYH